MTTVRSNAWTSGSAALGPYAAAVAAMKAKSPSDPTSWVYQAAIHESAASNPPPGSKQCRHQSWWFTPWHRMYLYWFERIVRAEVAKAGFPHPENWALPYWNYSDPAPQSSLPDPFRQTGPLYDANRGFGNDGTGLPGYVTSTSIAMACPRYIGSGEFGGDIEPAGPNHFPGFQHTGRLEQTPHNDVHAFIGGDMGNTATAALDPIFWLHHANIDRLWWHWQQGHPGVPYFPAWLNQSFDFFDENGNTVTMLGRYVVDIVDSLGYTYDDAPAAPARPVPAPAAATPRVNWPPPWPARPAVAPAVVPAARPHRQLVGASEGSVRLDGGDVTTTVTIDDAAASALADGPGAAELEHRAFLGLDDITADHNPSVVYGVYVELPAEPAEADFEADHVGNVSLFGIERALEPTADEHPHGFSLAMEITAVLDRHAADGSWSQGGAVQVSFRPAGPAEPDVDEQGVPVTAHPDNPITIGRVSVSYQ